MLALGNLNGLLLQAARSSSKGVEPKRELLGNLRDAREKKMGCPRKTDAFPRSFAASREGDEVVVKKESRVKP